MSEQEPDSKPAFYSIIENDMEPGGFFSKTFRRFEIQNKSPEKANDAFFGLFIPQFAQKYFSRHDQKAEPQMEFAIPARQRTVFRTEHSLLQTPHP